MIYHDSTWAYANIAKELDKKTVEGVDLSFNEKLLLEVLSIYFILIPMSVALHARGPKTLDQHVFYKPQRQIMLARHLRLVEICFKMPGRTPVRHHHKRCDNAIQENRESLKNFNPRAPG